MKKILQTRLLLALTFTLTLATACSHSGTSSSNIADLAPAPAKASDEISIMNFNVENLFDNIHDENREDQTYLPLAKKQTPEHQAFCAKIPQNWYRDDCLNFDWSDEVVQAKLKNISEVILGVDEAGPDILVMEEVENDRILSQLNKEFLAKAGYKTQVLIEGPDERGIDIGLLSRLPIVGKPQLHKIPYVGKNDNDKKWMARSRGVLEVSLKTPTGETITVLGAHFPSQQNPRYWREQSVAFLKNLIAEKSKKGMVIASGDLNISTEEEKEAGFFRGPFSEVAQVSHLVGCTKCEGTHNYRGGWSFLDILMFSKDMSPEGKAAYYLEPDSIRVITHTPTPKRFNIKTKQGTSDHYPLYARIKKTPSKSAK